MQIRRIALSIALTLAVIPLSGALVSSVDAADQLILGKTLLVKDPQPGVDPTKRSILVFGRELASVNTIVGDPIVNGGTVEVIANGAASSSQTFPMPAGAFTPGGAGWKALGNPVIGYMYKDPASLNG